MATFCTKTDIETMNMIFDRIELVDANETPTEEATMWYVTKGYCDLTVSKRNMSDWYCLLKEMQGKPEILKKIAIDLGKAHMIDGQKFILDSSFCSYAYIINLDTEMLEFWVGCQRRAQKGNRYGKTADENGYYPCKLVKEFSLKEIASPNDVVKEMRCLIRN